MSTADDILRPNLICKLPSFLNVAYILQMYSEKCSEIPHLEGLNKIIFQTNVNIEEP